MIYGGDVMRFITLLLLLCIMTSGCITQRTIRSARRQTSESDGRVSTWYNPAYFLLIPLTVPADIVMFPLLYFAAKGAAIDG